MSTSRVITLIAFFCFLNERVYCIYLLFAHNWNMLHQFRIPIYRRTSIHSFLAFPKCGITYLLIVWNVRIILLLNDIHRHFSCNFNYALLTRIVYIVSVSCCISCNVSNHRVHFKLATVLLCIHSDHCICINCHYIFFYNKKKGQKIIGVCKNLVF